MAHAEAEHSRARTLAQSALVLTVGNLIASALNYVSNVVFGRMLGPLGYAELSTLLSLTVVLGVVATAGQTVLAERVAHYRQRDDMHTVAYLGRHGVAHMLVAGLVVGGLILAATPLLMDLFRIDQPGPIFALALLSAVSFVLPVALGLAQGLERSGAYALLVVSAALGRLVIGSAWALGGGGAGGALAGQALGIIAACFIGLYALRRHALGGGHGAWTTGLRRRPNVRALSASGTYVLFAVLSNIDMVVAKIVLSPHQAGLYAAISALVKIIAYMPAAALVLVVPRVAAESTTEGRQRVLRFGAALAVGLMAVVALPMLIVPHEIISVVFGAEYDGASVGLRWGVFAGLGLGLISLLVTYAVAIGHARWQVTLLVGMVSFGICVTLAHDAAIDVVRAQAVAVLAALLVNEAGFHRLLLLRPRRRA